MKFVAASLVLTALSLASAAACGQSPGVSPAPAAAGPDQRAAASADAAARASFAGRSSATPTELADISLQPGDAVTDDVEVDGALQIASVPELETWSLMAAGLGTIIFVTRRRRART